MKDTNMKLNKFANLLVIGLVLTVAASGCRKKPVGLTQLPGARAGNVPDTGPGGAIRPAPPISTDSSVIGGPGGPGDAHPSNAAGAHDGWIPDAEALRSD